LITFRIEGPEPTAAIFVNVKGDKTSAVGEVEWVDRKAPTPAGKTPDAALIGIMRTSPRPSPCGIRT